MKHKNMYYDNRYKYKLNMLEPGLIMMKIIGVLFVTGILFWVAGRHWISAISLFLAQDVFDWGTMPQAKKELNELVIYELHVRGFTKHPSSGVRQKGTCLLYTSRCV